MLEKVATVVSGKKHEEVPEAEAEQREVDERGIGSWSDWSSWLK